MRSRLTDDKRVEYPEGGGRIAAMPQEPWHVVGSAGEPAFQNGWANVGGANPSAGFYKDQLGVVRLQGFVRLGTVNSIIFTLPAGYRPAATLRIPVHNNAGTFGQLDIGADGTVKQSAGGNTDFALDGVSFRAEA